jgi:hypothetical protein
MPFPQCSGARAGLAEAVFPEVLKQLEAAGFMLQTGILIDTTLVRCAVRPPPLARWLATKNAARHMIQTPNGRGKAKSAAAIRRPPGPNQHRRRLGVDPPGAHGSQAIPAIVRIKINQLSAELANPFTARCDGEPPSTAPTGIRTDS